MADYQMIWWHWQLVSLGNSSRLQLPKAGYRRSCAGFCAVFQIEMFQTSIAGTMEQDQDDHNFGIRQGVCAMIFAFFRQFGCLKGRFCHHSFINFAEFICHKKNFSNFALGEHGEIDLFVFLHYKYTNHFAILQIFKQLYFRRTHVKTPASTHHVCSTPFMGKCSQSEECTFICHQRGNGTRLRGNNTDLPRFFGNVGGWQS